MGKPAAKSKQNRRFNTRQELMQEVQSMQKSWLTSLISGLRQTISTTVLVLEGKRLKLK